jgi:hypothetical protein
MNVIKVRSLNVTFCVLIFAVSALLCPPCARADQGLADFKAGIASTVITPNEPMWMAGYAARDKPSEGKIHDLNAKALALEDAQGTRHRRFNRHPPPIPGLDRETSRCTLRSATG